MGQLGMDPGPRSRLVLNKIIIRIILTSNVNLGHILRKTEFRMNFELMPIGNSGKTALLCHVRLGLRNIENEMLLIVNFEYIMNDLTNLKCRKRIF